METGIVVTFESAYTVSHVRVVEIVVDVILNLDALRPTVTYFYSDFNLTYWIHPRAARLKPRVTC
jgi:hypothetical protein